MVKVFAFLTRRNGVNNYAQVFPGRSRYMLEQPRWEDVATRSSTGVVRATAA